MLFFVVDLIFIFKLQYFVQKVLTKTVLFFYLFCDVDMIWWDSFLKSCPTSSLKKQLNGS